MHSSLYAKIHRRCCTRLRAVSKKKIYASILLMEKTALIFEGGGMRGLFTAGAVDAIIEKKLRFDAVYGVSAGSCHAISCMSKQKDRARRVNVNYCTRKDYFGLRCLLREGSMFGWGLIFDTLPNKLEPLDYDEFFRTCNSDNPDSTQYFIGVTNALTGEAEYLVPHNKQQLLDYSKASCSLPYICPPVMINSTPYFDGGVADSIPVRKALEDGCTKFAIVLTQSAGYRKQPEAHPLIARLFYRKYPSLVSAMEKRHETYNKSLGIVKMLEDRKQAIVIRPPKAVNVGRLERNPDKLNALCYSGYELAIKAFN